MSNPYNLLEVFIDGESLQARPTKWDSDEDGNPVRAIEYETACPRCGQLTVIIIGDVSHECQCEAPIEVKVEAVDEMQAIKPQKPPKVIRQDLKTPQCKKKLAEEKELNIEGLGKEEEIIITNSVSKFRNPLDFNYPLTNIIRG